MPPQWFEILCKFKSSLFFNSIKSFAGWHFFQFLQRNPSDFVYRVCELLSQIRIKVSGGSKGLSCVVAGVGLSIPFSLCPKSTSMADESSKSVLRVRSPLFCNIAWTSFIGTSLPGVTYSPSAVSEIWLAGSEDRRSHFSKNCMACSSSRMFLVADSSCLFKQSHFAFRWISSWLRHSSAKTEFIAFSKMGSADSSRSLQKSDDSQSTHGGCIVPEIVGMVWLSQPPTSCCHKSTGICRDNNQHGLVIPKRNYHPQKHEMVGESSWSYRDDISVQRFLRHLLHFR